jgi:DNA-binding FrmR family transcriptional regulator
MFRLKDEKDRIAHRLKIARGHLDKVLRMVEDDAYCIDVLHQSQAVQKALKETDAILLENHLKNCTLDSFKQGKHEHAIAEILTVFRKGELS